MAYMRREDMALAVVLSELLDDEALRCDAGCGEPINPGDACYIQHDIEWDNWYHRRCVDGVTKCANCDGRGYVFTESLQAHHLIGGLGRSSVPCPVCQRRGWIRADA